MNTTREQAEEPINPLTDTGKTYLLVKRAVKDALAEERKRFDWQRFVRNIAASIVGEIDGRNK